MPVLIDATVLSNLAAVERLDLLNLLRDTLYVASAVYEEIQQGLDQGYEFLTNVDQALDSGLFLLITLKDEGEWRQYREMPGKLQLGEAIQTKLGVGGNSTPNAESILSLSQLSIYSRMTSCTNSPSWSKSRTWNDGRPGAAWVAQPKQGS